jgi:uncharacterized protein (DUF1501 family)
MLTRRFFIRGSAVVMCGLGLAPSWLARAAGEGGARRKILVAIFQRGAADGLNIVVPFSEKRYYELRPTIGVMAPVGKPSPNIPNVYFGPNGPNAIDLDGSFGLNPALQPLKDLWDKKQLAIVEAVGSPDPSRSHFDAQDYMESGTPGKTSGDGWLNRALLPADDKTSPLRAISIGPTLPRTLRGDRSAIAVGDPQNFQVANSSLLESMYAASPDMRLERTGKDAFAAMKMIQSIARQPNNSPVQNQYQQGGELGRSLQQVARLIKADCGVEAAFAEIGGWDHHGNEPGQLNNLLRQFGLALTAFATDMGDRMEDVVLVTMSEFGRTAHENGNAGTDHGHGSVMFVLGGPVAGGKVYGQWPGLEEEQLYEKRDLAVTTDFRTVLSELVTGHMGQKSVGQVFPGFKPGAKLGLLRA